LQLQLQFKSPVAYYALSTHLSFSLLFLYRAIKLSSPKLSNITAVGCIFVYATVILLGLDHSTLPSAEDSFATVCTVSQVSESLHLFSSLTLFNFRLCKQKVLSFYLSSSNMTFSFSITFESRLMCLFYLCELPDCRIGGLLKLRRYK